MGKRAPKLPVASAGGVEQERRKVVAITDSDWQRIEKAYRQKLLLEARRDIHEKTQEFVDRAASNKMPSRCQMRAIGSLPS
jgi:hypothetical protein